MIGDDSLLSVRLPRNGSCASPRSFQFSENSKVMPAAFLDRVSRECVSVKPTNGSFAAPSSSLSLRSAHRRSSSSIRYPWRWRHRRRASFSTATGISCAPSPLPTGAGVWMPSLRMSAQPILRFCSHSRIGVSGGIRASILLRSGEPFCKRLRTANPSQADRR